MDASSVRIALVHDWLTGMRGGEKVLEALCELYPHAELFTLLHVPGSISKTIERLPVHSSFIQHMPFARGLYRYYLPLFPLAIEQFDLDRFDLIVSTSHCAAKAVVKTGRARHLCYCFTPMRYAWDQFDAYFGQDRFGHFRSQLMRYMMKLMRHWDASTSRRVDRYVAISQYVADRINKYYDRTTTIIYPPVNTDFYFPDGRNPGNAFLVVSALVPYKRVDLAIESCRLARVPLRIVGDGPELNRLKKIAGPSVEFLGTVSDEKIRELYRETAALLLPGEEDFGIVPVEAQACGRPVIALGRGGACETVIHGFNGLLVSRPTPEAFANSLKTLGEYSFDSIEIRKYALRFSRKRFITAIQACVVETLETPKETARW